MNFQLMLFGALAGIAAITAIGVVACRDAVRSALCLVGNFFTLAFLYFTLNAEILGATQIVVYTGAIMVLFLFVIMLLKTSGPDALREKPELRWIFGGVFGLALFGLIAGEAILPLSKLAPASNVEGWGSPMNVGKALFTHYAWPFEMVSVLLLVGIVGSILLAKRRI